MIIKSSAVAEMGDRFATMDIHGLKVKGAAVPSYVEELDPHLTQCRLGLDRRLPLYQVAS